MPRPQPRPLPTRHAPDGAPTDDAARGLTIHEEYRRIDPRKAGTLDVVAGWEADARRVLQRRGLREKPRDKERRGHPHSPEWLADALLEKAADLRHALGRVREAAGSGDADGAARQALNVAHAALHLDNFRWLSIVKRDVEPEALFGRRVVTERRRGAASANAARTENRSERDAKIRAHVERLRAAGVQNAAEITKAIRAAFRVSESTWRRACARKNCHSASD